MTTSRPSTLALSVVAPARNEVENVRPLVEEIGAALDPLGLSYEIVIVDDGSTDGTLATLHDLLNDHPRLVVVELTPTAAGPGVGQSGALHAGFRVARGRLVASLDADLQNDPADLPGLLERLRATGADLVQGDRTRARRHGDTVVRRLSSFVAWIVRRSLLADPFRDTGCSLRIMRREVALALPLEFDGLHRFIPVMVRQLDYRVAEVPVRHRPRRAGTSSYGIWNRALPGLVDCLGVRWMQRRRRATATRRHVAAPPEDVIVTRGAHVRPTGRTRPPAGVAAGAEPAPGVP